MLPVVEVESAVTHPVGRGGSCNTCLDKLKFQIDQQVERRI